MTGPEDEKTRASSRRPTVVFLGFTSLSVGSGTEQFLLNIARNAPTDEFRVVVVETDFAPSRRWDDRYVAAQLGPVEVRILRSPRRSLDPDRLIEFASRSLGMYLLAAVAQPVLRSVSARAIRRKNEETLRFIESADLIYLIRNEDRDWLDRDPSRTVLVGSTHCDDLSGGLLAFESLPARGMLRSLYGRIANRSNRGTGRIDAYHVTQKGYWQNRLKRTTLDAYVPLGVDTARFRPGARERPSGNIRFLFVGGLEPQKGIDLLLDAWKQVASARGELHIVGQGRLGGRVGERALADPRIHFHGVLEPGALTGLYGSCDIFVLPSRYETLGLVVLEALSSGLYVLASETMRGVFDDFCEEGALEYLDTNPRPLSRRLQVLCENPPPLDDDLRDALHRRVESQYDWKRVTGELFEWFDRLLETRRQTRSPGPPPAHRTDDPSAVARQQVDAR